MSEITDAQRLAVIREICREEGHGDLVEVTTWADPHRIYICNRGCDLTIYKLREGRTLRQLAEQLGDGARVYVGAGQIVEVDR